jgi:hypothetical protein
VKLAYPMRREKVGAERRLPFNPDRARFADRAVGDSPFGHIEYSKQTRGEPA